MTEIPRGDSIESYYGDDYTSANLITVSDDEDRKIMDILRAGDRADALGMAQDDDSDDDQGLAQRGPDQQGVEQQDVDQECLVSNPRYQLFH